MTRSSRRWSRQRANRAEMLLNTLPYAHFMELVKCLECDDWISDNADKCHHCGTPNCSVSDRKLLEALDKSVGKIFLFFLGFLAIMLIIAVLAFG